MERLGSISVRESSWAHTVAARPEGSGAALRQARPPDGQAQGARNGERDAATSFLIPVRRVREGEEYVLYLQVAACTGCGACVESCPPQVIRLEEAPKEEVGQELELFRGKPPWYDL